MPSNLHNSLKTALWIGRTSITEYAQSLTTPRGKKGITHSHVINTAKGISTTPWLRKEIEQYIQASKRQYPLHWSDELHETEEMNV